MFIEMIRKTLKPMFEDEYNRGFNAGVTAERLVKDHEKEQREYDLLRRGAELGREELLKELESEVMEISSREFDELSQMKSAPFGFVGTMENMRLEGVE